MSLYDLANWAMSPEGDKEKKSGCDCGGKKKPGSCASSCGCKDDGGSGSEKKTPCGADKKGSCGANAPCGGGKKGSCSAEKKDANSGKKGPCSPGSCSPGSCVGAPKKGGEKDGGKA